MLLGSLYTKIRKRILKLKIIFGMPPFMKKNKSGVDGAERELLFYREQSGKD